MRIPLDYYRILGLPIQATADQLRQAHRDRTLQLPRREYSDAAVTSRKKLLDEAYAILSNPERRKLYDTNFLAKTYEVDPGDRVPSKSTPSPSSDGSSDSPNPSVEIQDDQFVGALLILQDLGEYELVLKLGRPFLTGGSASLKGGQYGDPGIVYSDIVLTVALACLELGREQWQQGQYENASEALETGQQLLLREGLFASVRGEIQADLYKLRPYRVLELLALPEHRTEERYRGMQLLQDMLHERDGIDGSGDDQSGLNIDDFLRFIQQLRGYLTAAEQQVLFEQEAQRPSAVATYLGVYALLARGFAECQPVLVRRAKVLLMRLSNRQDVHLEQAVCALLLGQTEEASRALELSQEYGPLAFIREHSQGSPDLLPGLCLYAERWLQDEVFPQFRDLADQQASLKDYFADPQVQAYLEELPNEAEVGNQWMLERSPVAATVNRQEARVATNSFSRSPAFQAEPMNVTGRGGVAPDRGMDHDSLIEVARSRIAARSATATLTGDRPPTEASTVPPAERVDQIPMEDKPTATRPAPVRRTGGGRPGGNNPNSRSRNDALDERVRQRSLRSNRPGWMRFLPYAAVLLGMVALGFLIAWVIKAAQTASSPKSQEQIAPAEEKPLVQLDVPLLGNSATPDAVPTDGTLNNVSAQKLVETWLAAKASAMGPDHNMDALDQILTDPKLSEWKGAAGDEKQNGTYRKYKHTVKVTSVEQSKDKPDQAKVAAEVSESTDFYEGDRLSHSKNDAELRIQYDLTRIDNKWRIQNWQVIQ